MTNDVADLHEFNEKISQIESGTRQRGSRVNRPSDAVDSPSCEPKNRANEGVVNSQMWAMYGDSNYSACEKAVPCLPPGQYTINTSDHLGIYFSKADVNLDELVNLPDSVSEQVVSEIESFWQKEHHFRKFGFLWKRGVLMWGPPGSGKTTCLQTISSHIIERGGISIYVDNPTLAAKGVKLLRQVEKTRPLVMMLEDIDAIIETYGESYLLALMDGELQIDNVVFVATTNYPERLDKRFINRPSRFDIVKKIGMPSPKAREIYIKTKNTRLAEGTANLELMEWVKLTKNFSIAHMKELIVSVEVFGVPLSQAVARLRTMMEYSPKSQDEAASGNLGFSID